MPQHNHQLAFENEIYALEARLAKLEKASDDAPESREEIRRWRRELTDLKTEDLQEPANPGKSFQVARHPDRPMTTDYLKLVFDEFVELHGDRTFGDDRAIRTGFAKLDEFKVMFIGHHKGKSVKEKYSCYYGCAHPEGYRKALHKMQLAAKYGMPVISFVDTPGAYPGIGAEERGQASVIATNLLEMARLNTPIVTVVSQ